MARETKTVQCYPSDSKINDECELQASFGWELIGNQRCREEHTYGEYIRTSTFHKLTFSREKSSPWYDEVVKLEKQYNRLADSEPRCYASEPSKGWLLYGILGLVFGVLSILFISGIGALSFLFFVPLALCGLGILLLTVFGIKKSRYNRDYSRYWSALSAWKETGGKEAEEIRSKAEALVNG